MYNRLLTESLPLSRSFCLLGAKGVGKTTLIRDFAANFINPVHLDLETAEDRGIFQPGMTNDETLRAICFLKGKEFLGNGTLIVLDEIGLCPEAIRWTRGRGDKGTGGRGDNGTGGRGDKDGPMIVATSSFLSKELMTLTTPENGLMQSFYLHPFSFEEFLMVLNDIPALEAFREVPVPYYAYEKLLNYFHLYALIGGMPQIIAAYTANHNLTELKYIYDKIHEGFVQCLQHATAARKSLVLAVDVLQNAYPYAATRISLNRFGNLEKGSREIGKAFKALEHTFSLRMIFPVTTARLPLMPDLTKFPRLQMLDTGLVNYFSGIQKPLFQSHDMNAIFEGQIARQVVGQEILATMPEASGPFFWVRKKAQSSAAVDFVVPFDELLIPVVVRSGEAGRLRSLHQYVDESPHPFAVRLHAGKLTIQQSVTIKGKRFFLMNLPYFLAGKIREHLGGFKKYVEG
ncbi:MAG: AAA family ATPase [Bacteroidales bacterium]|nr:AAA family ATPase [Bacteroidales bacterium]